MNAPRQGLFASLLIISFALHTFLSVIATTHQLNENRANQGQLMTSQLVTDSLNELDPPNTVSLALLASRYATNPSVASIRILDVNKQLLATGGMSQTRRGEIFVRDALQNEEKVGTIEITLIKPSIGEILRTQWLAILASLIIHGFLWIAYRTIARPSRSEYLARINTESRLSYEIQQLTQALEREKQNALALIAQVKQQPKKEIDPDSMTKKEDENLNQGLALNIQFYDPKQLLNSVNHSISAPYFRLCQLFLNKSIELCTQHYGLDQSTMNMRHEFDESGADLTITSDEGHAVECLLMINAVFQLLALVIYKRYREDKRFALQIRSSISTPVAAMQLNAVEAAQRLTTYLHAKESAIHLNQKQLDLLNNGYKLIAIPTPSNVLTRHAFMLNGMTSACAELAQKIRTEILMGKNEGLDHS